MSQEILYVHKCSSEGMEFDSDTTRTLKFHNSLVYLMFDLYNDVTKENKKHGPSYFGFHRTASFHT